MQGRTDSGHLYVMDPTDILSTGARGMGSSPLGFELTEAGEQDPAGVTTVVMLTPSLHAHCPELLTLTRLFALPGYLHAMLAVLPV